MLDLVLEVKQQLFVQLVFHLAARNIIASTANPHGTTAAQAGVPLTSGFVAKWGVIQAAVEQESYAIAIIAMVSAVVAAYLYLRIMVSTWLREGAATATVEPVPVMTGVSACLAAAFTLAVGVYPQCLLDAAENVVAYAR